MIRTLILIAFVLCFSSTSLFAQSSSVRPPDSAAIAAPPPPPANLLPRDSDSDIWRMIRQGDAGNAAGPEFGGGHMIQSEGDLWRTFRNGPYQNYAIMGLVGFIGLLALFYALRGRISVAGGEAGVEIQRFAGIERFAHWLTATSFIVLAITGINLVIGTNYILPLIGKETFAMLTGYGKLAHNFLGFSFLVGITLMFVLWVWHNFPHPRDIVWFLQGGGIVGMGHPKAGKFNAGQKIIFWVTILGGVSLGMSGLALMFPYQFDFFAKTTPYLNTWFGLELPTAFTPIQEQQLNQTWHGIVGIVMTAIIMAHIYIGSIGMRGAFAAMGKGRVDLNWAKEHHSLWVEKLRSKGKLPIEPKRRENEVAAE